jgi:sugar phosphate isomerase/epimerase
MSDKKKALTRRQFISQGSKLTAGIIAASTAFSTKQAMGNQSALETAMQFGLVTYLWGKDWELPELIRNCRKAGVYGVELRVNHAHGVSPKLNSRERYEVRLRFELSPVKLLGFGTNYAFHYTDKKVLQANLQGAKEYVRLSHELGGSGVKVKPNALPDGVPVEQTIVQIGTLLNELGEYADKLGQEIRLEVHGQETSRLPIIAQIFNFVTQPNVSICWNCNESDLWGKGLKHNFKLVKNHFGHTVHIHELDIGNYPYQQFFNLMVKMNYNGWILLEAYTNPGNRITALQQQNQLFKELVSNAN